MNGDDDDEEREKTHRGQHRDGQRRALLKEDCCCADERSEGESQAARAHVPRNPSALDLLWRAIRACQESDVFSGYLVLRVKGERGGGRGSRRTTSLSPDSDWRACVNPETHDVEKRTAGSTRPT